MILVSDGIINQGVFPSFQKYPFNVHTIGYGDTTSVKDLSINGISANKIAYLGNKFLVNVDINSTLLKGKSTIVNIKNGQGKILQSKTLSFHKLMIFKPLALNFKPKKKESSGISLKQKHWKGSIR